METLTRWQDPTIEQQKKEIDRLNNIINELEEYLKKLYIQRKDRSSYKYGQDYKEILNKLQELKENK